MSKKSLESLIDAAKQGMEQRPSGRLAGMLNRATPRTIAEPLQDDTYSIALDHIQPNPNQPRKHFDEQKLRELADSIAERGVQQPIVVDQTDNPELFVIITGERRWRASRLAGLDRIPCIVRGPEYDRSLIDLDQLIENVQRADLEPIEAAHAVQSFMDRHGFSQVQAAKRIGKSRTWLVELVSILKIGDQLLEQAASLPKQSLIEIARHEPERHEQLIQLELASRPAETGKRLLRKPRERHVYYSESFGLENLPAIEVRWKRHPQEVTDLDVAEALAKVIAQLRTRRLGS